jgi:aryl carrier-like protein
LGDEQEPQLRRPIGKSETQSLLVGMASPDACLDSRDLLAATLDSCRLLQTLPRYLIERPLVTV